jgi:TorA maturation chaperone TorD
MQTIELRNDLADREAAYRLLSACYYQPGADWDEADLFSHLSGFLDAISPEASAAARRMSVAWGESDPAELTVDYARLFVGPMALQSPPYGSVYLDIDHKVMGASTVEVLRFYREAGLNMDDDFSEMPDHIAVELEFVSYLLQRAAASDNDKDLELWLDRGRYFVDTFLGPWYGRLCAGIRSNTDNRFYAALADCTELLVSRGLPTFTA